MELSQWSFLAAVALATAAVSVAISKSKIFRWLRRKTKGPVHALVICHFCLNFWFSAAFLSTLNVGFNLFIIITWLATVALATLASGLLIFAVPFPDDIEEFDQQ